LLPRWRAKSKDATRKGQPAEPQVRKARLTRDACRAAFDDAFNFSQRGHAGVAGCGHGQSAVGYAALDGPFDAFAGEQAVDEAGGEAVAAANAVEDVDLALGDVNDLVLIERDCAPGIAAGGLCGAQVLATSLRLGYAAATSRSISS
jgi:hypothetical protein